MSAETVTITVTAADCAGFIAHVPDADVAYRPGVDVEGEAVAPADIGGGIAVPPPTEIEIPIQIDLQGKIGVPANPDLFQTKDTTVGSVLWRDGRAWYNGVPLQDEEAARIARLCQEIRRGEAAPSGPAGSSGR